MKTFKIIKHDVDDYTVDVNHTHNQDNTSHDFDDKYKLDVFVSKLKSKGYASLNDMHV